MTVSYGKIHSITVQLFTVQNTILFNTSWDSWKKMFYLAIVHSQLMLVSCLTQ